jgi:hypothetical protein
VKFQEYFAEQNGRLFENDIRHVPALHLVDKMPGRVNGVYVDESPPVYQLRKSLLTGGGPLLPGDEHAVGRQRYIKDIILRLMLRQWCAQYGRDDKSSKGYGPQFRLNALEVSERLGMPGDLRYANQYKADKKLPMTTTWPHCFRPGGYYLGALMSERSLQSAN